MKIDLNHLDETIAECSRLVASSEESQSTLDRLLEFRAFLESTPETALEAYHELLEKLPMDGEDPVLIVLKGQLLIEKLVRKFIATRLSNPEALEKKVRFSAAQCISLGEAMCLQQDEPKWLWAQVRELNSIRNQLAHSFIEDKTEERIARFIETISEKQELTNKTLTGAISRIYGMLRGLNDGAEAGQMGSQKVKPTDQR